MNHTYFTKPTKQIPTQLSSNSYTFIYFTAKKHMSELIQLKTYYDTKRLPTVPMFPERIVLLK